MLKEVDQQIAKGETDDQILQAFVKAYGTQVYTEPPKSGFSLVCLGIAERLSFLWAPEWWFS